MNQSRLPGAVDWTRRKTKTSVNRQERQEINNQLEPNPKGAKELRQSLYTKG